jgi:hemoglobin
MMDLFALLGGEVGVRALVDRFYDAMDADPRFAALRALHPPDLAASRDHLFWFLVGWTGGPPMYVERKGHPRLRARHLPFTIGTVERDQWLACMDIAIAGGVTDARAATALRDGLAKVADHMRNTPDPA